VLPRTPGAIRDWLRAHSPAEAAHFENEYRNGLSQAADTFDLDAVDAVVHRWWTLIWGRSQQLTPGELDQLERLERGEDVDGLNTYHR